MSRLYFLTFLLAFLTILSGYFSTAETAFFSLSSSKIHSWRHSVDKRRRHVAWLLARSHYLLVLIFMLDNIADVFLQNAASDLFDSFGGGWLLKVGIPLLLILVFGEFLPKYIGLLWNESFAIRSASTFVSLERVMAPIQRCITSFAEISSRALFFFLKPEPPLTTREVEAAIKTCEAQGILSPEEASLVTHTLTFEKKLARELMTPRAEMRVIQRSHLSSLLPRALSTTTNVSPLLIVDETADRPIGVLSNTTILGLRDKSPEALILQASRDLFFVPETMPARRLLHEFSSKQGVIACVIDEYGCISGYIEWERVLQEILGFYARGETPLYHNLRPKQRSLTLPGSTPLETVNSLFGSSIRSKFYTTTLGGWLTEVLDAIPQTGTTYSTDELSFKILSATDKMVQHVFVQRKNMSKRGSP